MSWAILRTPLGLLVMLLAISACGMKRTRVELRQEGPLNQLVADGTVIHSTRAKILAIDEVVVRNEMVAVSWSEGQSDKSSTMFSLYSKDVGWTEARLSQLDMITHRGRVDFQNPVFGPDSNLALLQLKTQTVDEYLSELKSLGILIVEYLGGQSYVISLNRDQYEKVLELEFVHAVGHLPPEIKSNFMTDDNAAGEIPVGIVPISEDSVPQVIHSVNLLGGKVLRYSQKALLIEAMIPKTASSYIIALPHVQWVQGLTPPSVDMDIVRAIIGADYLNELPDNVPLGYTGRGIRGHIMEGIDPDHPDFAATTHREKPIAVDAPEPTSHGHSTFGIVFGSGAGNPKAKGLLPNGQGYYTNYDTIKEGDPQSSGPGTRYELVGRLIKDHRVMFQTASWGHGRTIEYDVRSAELDRIIFDHDLPITQSQSNACSQDSRPQAWSKNVISVGAVFHYENLDKADDRWRGMDFGCSSIGPAKDGRIKPDLVAFYDEIFTTGLGNSYTNFGGTSGATPIVAGILGLTIEMYTNGLFRPLPYPEGDRFDNRPHFTTAKALLINGAHRYDFDGPDHDMARPHQGWGLPSAKSLHEQRDKIFVVNEDVVLKNLETHTVELEVLAGEPELRVTMTYPDPVGSLMAEKNRVNNLDLKVTAPNGDVFWGNYGLKDGNISAIGGSPDVIDTVENVFVKTPAQGVWKIEVIGAELNEDGYPLTSELDSRFALVVAGVKKP